MEGCIVRRSEAARSAVSGKSLARLGSRLDGRLWLQRDDPSARYLRTSRSIGDGAERLLGAQDGGRPDPGGHPAGPSSGQVGDE
jgi:hypothetical protein